MQMYVVVSGSSFYMNDGTWLPKSRLNGYIPKLYMSQEWAEHDAKRLYNESPAYPKRPKIESWTLNQYHNN